MNNFIIFAGSFLSAIPLTTTYLTYENDPLYKAIPLTIIIQADNTVLHFLPIKLILSQPLYRLPLLPFELVYKLLLNCFLTADQKKDATLKKQLAQATSQLIGTLNGRLLAATNALAHSTLTFNPCKAEYSITLPDNFHALTLETLLEHAPDIIPQKGCFHQSCEKAAFLAGALWLSVGTIGYLANPFTLFDELLKNAAQAAGITAVPIYALAILAIFLAGNMMVENFNAVLDTLKGKQNLALEVKLYPKTFILLELTNIYFALFSYAAAAEMIEDNAEKTERNFDLSIPDSVRLSLVWSAISSLTFLALNAVHSSYKTLLRKFTLYFGSAEAKDLVELQEKLVQLTVANTLIKPEKLKEQLQGASFTAAQSQTFFGQSSADVTAQLTQAEMLSRQPSHFQRFRSWF